MSTSLRSSSGGFRPNDAVSGLMFFCGWIVLVFAVLFVAALLAPRDIRPVLIPLMAALLIATGFFLGIARRQGWAAPIFHIGSFYAAVVLIYTVYPLAVYLKNGQMYHPL